MILFVPKITVKLTFTLFFGSNDYYREMFFLKKYNQIDYENDWFWRNEKR